MIEVLVFHRGSGDSDKEAGGQQIPCILKETKFLLNKKKVKKDYTSTNSGGNGENH